MKIKGLLDPDKALGIVLDSVPKMGIEETPLRDSLGRVLAEDVYAGENLPPFDNTAMDGYAVIADDTRGASEETPRRLRVIAEEPAGTVVTQPVVPGTAVRIMTGAQIPPGADAIVIVEHTYTDGSEVCAFREVSPGENIRRAGEDVVQGQLVVKAGARIRPAEMGMLGALGVSQVKVYRKPRVAIVTVGDELVDASETLGPGQIRNSNQFSLLGQTLRAGGEVVLLKLVSDDKAEVEETLRAASEAADVLITCGGVSVGDYDFVKEVLAKLGDILLWKVAIKPGKPFAFGHVNGKPLFGLPGNPVSAMVTFDLFVRPALLRMSGVESVSPTPVSGIVTKDLRRRPGRREYVRARTAWQDDGYIATPSGKHGSGMLSSMLEANSYIVFPEDKGDVAAGERVQIVWME